MEIGGGGLSIGQTTLDVLISLVGCGDPLTSDEAATAQAQDTFVKTSG